VAFAGFAELIQPPTTEKEALRAALRSLLTGTGTAIGSGILKSLDAIAVTDQTVAPSAPNAHPEIGELVAPKETPAADVIVLLTGGVSDTGPPPLDAAREAAERGVPVYTVGFGTANGIPSTSCQSSDPSGFGGPASSASGAGEGAFPRGIDELTLKRIAAMTGGAYYPASSARELESVFSRLGSHTITKHERLEMSVAFVGAGALLAAVAWALALAWHPLP
jgi:Ca-activated chloride channel family protein